MSCAIPFIFQPVFYNNKIYGDGGLINPFPINKCILETNVKKKKLFLLELLIKIFSL